MLLSVFLQSLKFFVLLCIYQKIYNIIQIKVKLSLFVVSLFMIE